MATQKCPRCQSTRIRLAYRQTSFFSKMLFRYNLLCDDCNWIFKGFAIPGTVSNKTKKKKQSGSTEEDNIKGNINDEKRLADDVVPKLAVD